MSATKSAAAATPAAAGTDAGAAAAAAGAATETPAAAAAAGAATGGDAGAAAAAGAAGDGKGGDAAAAAAAAGPPDKYELALPDETPLEESDLTAFAELAKSKGWTNEQAQAALTEHSNALAAQSGRFLTELQGHSEIGGDKLAAAQQHAKAVLDKFLPADSPEGKVLRSGFNKSGYGNWTPLVLLLSRIGKAMAEDSPAGAGAVPSGGPKSAAEALYGKS